MVYAFLIHTLLPGPCRILYSATYDNDEIAQIGNGSAQTAEIPSDSERSPDIMRSLRKQALQEVAESVQSAYEFRRTVSGRSIEQDLNRLQNEDILPDFELGFLRLPADELYHREKVAVWLCAANCGFSLVCHKHENRVVAENVLKLIIKYLQEHLRILNQPTESLRKGDRVELVLGKFLPRGQLLFLNSRVVRQYEKELDSVMKT